MQKIAIEKNVFMYPMPMVVVGALVEQRPNFMAVGWITRVNANPPMLAIALGRHHYTNVGIHEAKAFSVNVPGTDLLEKVDYCGIVSGRKEDKSTLFTVSAGAVTGAPMIEECPLCLECKLASTMVLPTNEIFVGEIVGAYAAAECCSNGKPDIRKLQPFVLTMPDNQYWTIGDSIGQAWSLGAKLKH